MKPTKPEKGAVTKPPKHTKPRAVPQYKKPKQKKVSQTTLIADEHKKIKVGKPLPEKQSYRELKDGKLYKRRRRLQSRMKKIQKREFLERMAEADKRREADPEKWRRERDERLEAYKKEREQIKKALHEEIKRLDKELRENMKTPKKGRKPRKKKKKTSEQKVIIEEHGIIEKDVKSIEPIEIKTETGKVVDKIINEPDVETEDKEQLERIKKLKEDRDFGRISDEDYYNEFYTQGAQVYAKIKNMIAKTVGATNEYRGDWLYNTLQEEIDRFGFQLVMRSLGMAEEEELYYADVVLHHSSDEEARVNLLSLVALIQRNIPNTSTRKQIDEAGFDEAYDFSDTDDWIFFTFNQGKFVF